MSMWKNRCFFKMKDLNIIPNMFPKHPKKYEKNQHFPRESHGEVVDKSSLGPLRGEGDEAEALGAPRLGVLRVASPGYGQRSPVWGVSPR